jgi:hypothetical protein
VGRTFTALEAIVCRPPKTFTSRPGALALRDHAVRRGGTGDVRVGHLDRTAQFNLCNLLRSDTPTRVFNGKATGGRLPFPLTYPS